MCDVGMKEAIEKLVEAIEGKIINVDSFTAKFETVSPWINPDYALKIKERSTAEELKVAAKLGLKNKGIVPNIEFYDVPSPERIYQAKDGGLKINCDGIKVNYGNGTIALNHEGLSFDFGIALEYIKKGIKVCRRGWNGRGMFVQCQVPDTWSKMSQPYIYITNGKKLSPWTPSQEDIFANDWMVYNG